MFLLNQHSVKQESADTVYVWAVSINNHDKLCRRLFLSFVIHCYQLSRGNSKHPHPSTTSFIRTCDTLATGHNHWSISVHHQPWADAVGTADMLECACWQASSVGRQHWWKFVQYSLKTELWCDDKTECGANSFAKDPNCTLMFNGFIN